MTNLDDVANWKVLLVEDDPDNVALAEQILAFYGAKVFTARNGVQGLALLETVTPTVILLDLSMPHMDGWEMAKKIRANSAIAHLPVIAVTAYAMQEDRERALANGFDGYIVKPYAIRTFIPEIQAWLAKFKA